MDSAPAFADPRVEAVFAAYPPEARDMLMRLRGLVFNVAAQTEGVGPIEEALRWGEPSYMTPVSRSGSLIRMDAKARYPGKVSVFFHCQTNLIAQFESLFAGQMTFVDNREIRFAVKAVLPVEALRVCFAAALTYHLRKG